MCEDPARSPGPSPSSARCPCVMSSSSVRPISSFEAANAELRHQLARFFGDEEEVVHHVLGLAFELAAQHRVLRRHAHRAGIEVALAHHDAALDHQRRGGEAELVGAEHGADHHVAAGLHLPVDLHRDPAPQAIKDQCLLRFREAELPGRAGMLDRRPGRGAGAAVVPGDRDVVGLAPSPRPPRRCRRRPRRPASPRSRPAGLAFFRSWISCARSSIE